MQLTILLACLLVSADATNSTKDASEEVEVNDQNKANSTKEILKASESGDPAKAEIVKQIRRLNEDGSYTIGYEADDGTFKIESRDVLGNVKGTFGYVDRDGEIKRVTYSSSSEGTPVPVTSTSTTPLPPPMIIRMNKTVSSSTTRRPLGTVVYPTRGGGTTRGTVIQSIAPRRRNITRTTTTETTTEREKPEATTSNILNLYKPKMDENVMKRKSDDDLITKQSSVNRSAKTPHTVKPVYEHSTEKEPENKPNTFRRELPGTSTNHHMLHLQQSAGDDSTDVYGGHQSMGTVRPLFTTTTPRPRLVPFNSILAARQRLQQQYPDIQQEEQETTIEASTGRVFDHENVVTSNPVPVVYNPPNNQQDDRIYQQPIYRRPTAIHFRTNEYLRDNPGSAIPIGNQRPFLHYENQPQVLEPQYVRETSPPPQAKGTVPEAATVSPYDGRQVTRIIPIVVDERGVPLQGYHGRYVNPYRPQTQQPAPPVLFQPRYVEPAYDEMNSISTPVSTRDLKRLLQILIIRQNRLQALMDQIVTPPGPPYQPLPMLRQQQYEYQPRPSQQQPVRYQQAMAPQYQDDPRYDYRYDQQQERQQQDVYYNNQVYDPQYESQRFVPRRRLYTRPVYDNSGSSSNQIEDTPEYLPPDVREALLLKMLMLAISPDFMPSPPPATEMTTAAPARKQVRNIQILGEEGSMMHDMKRPVHRN